MNELDVRWMLTRPVKVQEEIGSYGYRYRVTALDGTRECELSLPDGRKLLFNGQYVDVGDDYPAYLGLIDAAAGSPGGTAVIADE